MSEASDPTRLATLLGLGTWTQQGPATLVVREAGWVVLVPGLRKEITEAAWTVLGEKPAPKTFLERLVEVANLESADKLTAILFGFLDGTTGTFGVKGRTPIAVYTPDGAHLVAGTDDEPFVLRTFEGVRRTAFGDLPTEDPVGAPRVSDGIARVRGFVHVTVDPADLGEESRAALADQVEAHGRSIADPEATTRRQSSSSPSPSSSATSSVSSSASGGASAPSASSASSASTIRKPAVAGRRSGELPSSIARGGASSRAAAPAAQTEGPNMFAGLFADPTPEAPTVPVDPGRTAPGPERSTAAQLPAESATATPAPAPSAPAPAPAPSAVSTEKKSEGNRRRLVSTSLFDRKRRSAEPSDRRTDDATAVPAETAAAAPAPSRPAASPDPTPALSIPTPNPPEDGDGPQHEAAPAAPPPTSASRPEPTGRSLPAPEFDHTGAYDDLFGKTIFRRIEDAAVRRVDDDGEEGLAGVDSQESSSGDHAPTSSATPSADVAPAEGGDGPPAEQPMPLPDAPAVPAATGDFIDWVPGVGRKAPEIAQAAARRAAQPSPPESAYPQVNMAERPLQQVASPGPSASPRPAPGQVAHSGLSSESSASAAGPTSGPRQQTGGTVALSGLVCPHGHANSPEHSTCRACGTPLHGAPRIVARPALGAIEMSTGERIVLERSVIFGRRPRASRVSGNDVPQLVTVPSPQQDISRSHLELRLEGWHVVALDLGTTNGTTLYRDGADPLRLRTREGVVLYEGDHLDLGDDLHLWMRERA